MYLNREYLKANVYTIWVHGPSGLERLERMQGILSHGAKSAGGSAWPAADPRRFLMVPLPSGLGFRFSV